MKKAEAKLRLHVAVLSNKCQEMDATISSLDKVRDAIHVISLCPGLEPANFAVPTWTGEYLTANFDSRAFTDAQIDMNMNALCAASQKGDGLKPRAAETAEIEMKTILNLEDTNTAGVPLMGSCPRCEGALDTADTIVT